MSFVRDHTALEPVPFVPEIRLHVASEVTPLWHATAEWLGHAGVDVPFWSVAWAGGQALARYVLDHPELVRGKHVVDFGSGSGLVAIAAARAGAADVRAIDIDPLAAEACRLNAAANAVSIASEACDPIGKTLDADVLLAGDVWYDRDLADRLAPWLATLSAAGTTVITGDPGRTYVPTGMLELARYDVPTPLDLESRSSRLTRVLRAR